MRMVFISVFILTQSFFLGSVIVAADVRVADEYSSVAKTVLIDDVEVASRDAGIVSEVAVKVGEWVKSNATLITLDNRISDHDLQVAALNNAIAKMEAACDADLQMAKLSLRFKSQRLARAMQANERLAGSVTASEIEQLSYDFDEARLSGEFAGLNRSIKQKMVELKAEQEAIAELQMSYRTIRSPISGTIVEVRKQAGEAITASDVAVRIVNLDRLRVVSHVRQDAIDSVSVGDPVFFVPSRHSSDNRNVRAVVTFINPQLNAEEGVFEVWAEFDNRELKLFGGEAGTLVIRSLVSPDGGGEVVRRFPK